MSTTLIATLLTLTTAVVPVMRPDDGVNPPRMTIEEVLARCSSPAGFRSESSQVSARGDQAGYRFPEGDTETADLLLVRGDRGLDIIQVYGQETLWRASRSEADLLDSGGDGAPYHLVLNAENGPEHFLFSVAGDGNGELLWGTAEGMIISECRV